MIRSSIDTFEEELHTKDIAIERYKQDNKNQSIKLEELNDEVY